MGAQSMDDRILKLNNRGHTAQETLDATAMLRAGGFKVVLHWDAQFIGRPRPKATGKTFSGFGVKDRFARMSSRSIPASYWNTLNFTSIGSAAITIPIPKRLY